MGAALHTTFVVIGAGGLGCPALLGLVDAGARRITIIDDDTVDASNLHRQVLFGLADVGVSKAKAARAAVLGRARQPLAVTALDQRLRADDLAGLLEPAGAPVVVLECSDDPSLKFAVHDACLDQGIPVVVAGVIGWRGQVMAVDPRRRDRACYRCLFEAPPPPELAPACAAVGVIGAVAGALGYAMAVHAVDLAERGSTAGALTHFDLLAGSVRRLAPKPRPDCSACGHLRNNHGALP